MPSKMPKITPRDITPLDVVSFDGGLDERGDYNSATNTFVYGRNVMPDQRGLLTQRYVMKRWLPDTVETVYQIYGAVYNGELYYFTADDGRIKYCQDGDTSWTVCGTANTQASLTTALTGTNNDLKFTAYDSKTWYGTLGNAITIAYVNAGASKPLVVSVASNAISVQLATNGSSVITSTASQILAAVNAHTTASKMVVATLAAGNDGTGVVTALAATNLTGGVNGTNQFTTGTGVKTMFSRVLDKVMIVNGVEKIAYVDLATMNVTKYTALTNPSNAPTASVSGSGLTLTGSFKIYYAISFNSSVGETAISPIYGGAANVSKDRYSWKSDGTDYIDVARNNTAPGGAKSWNLYMATKAAGGTVAATDLLPLAQGLDINTTTFRDNGALPLNLSAGTAPQDNSTDGPTCRFVLETGGRPILYGDVNNPYNIWIGGDGDNALDFSPNNGGYRVEVSKGTNYYPTNIVGFRNGQGIPSLTVLFSNPNGLSRQAILEQQTVTYSNISFVVWGVTEQNYGSAGVAAPYGVLNYLGGLYFPSTDGFVRMDTEASLQNVLSTKRITDAVYQTVGSIKNTALGDIVGAAWDNKIIWSIPSRGYDFNNELLIHDMKNTNNPIWYKWDIRAQWVGVISPSTAASFVYVCQDNHIFRLVKGYVAADENSLGALVPFATEARGGWSGLNPAHNEYKAVVQVVYDMVDVLGSANLTVSYLRGKTPRSQTKVANWNTYATSSLDGWDNSNYTYENGDGDYGAWDDIAPLSGDAAGGKTREREKIRLKSITNEVQWQISTDQGTTSSFIARAISFEGVNLGNKVDLR